MFDRLIEIFRELPGSGFRDRGEKFADNDPRLAAAALLFHLMDVDGEAHESEREKLSSLLSVKYGLKGEALKQLLKAAEDADHEAMDLSNFTAILKRQLDHAGQLDFLSLMWEMVCADGHASEIEATVVWRVAELLGISDHDRKLIQTQLDTENLTTPSV